MLPLLLVAAASLTAIGAINATLATRQTQQRIERLLNGVTAMLSTTNFPLTDSVLVQMRGLSGAEYIVSNRAGETRSATFARRPETIAPPQIERRGSPLGARVMIDGDVYFHKFAELPARANSSEALLLHVLFPEADFRSAWRGAFLPPIVVGILTIAAVAIVASLIAARISRGAARLGAEMERIARGDFTPAELPTRDDEIRDLSLAINRTAETLADYEREVRHTEQMRTVAMLGAGLAHEMRNAATGCRMALDLHANECPAHGDDESLTVAKRQLRLMEKQLQRFLRAGKSTDDTANRPLELAALVEELLPLVRPAARHARVELRWRRSAEATHILGDGETLGQAVVNLLLNAIEAVQQPGGGDPRVVEATLGDAQAGFAELVVSDNGPGPAAATTESLFSPFVTTKPEGVGLGLAVAKQIVEAHRGTIDWVRSSGQTRFRILLPTVTKGPISV
jgi:signal transduction histidine kinase